MQRWKKERKIESNKAKKDARKKQGRKQETKYPVIENAVIKKD